VRRTLRNGSLEVDNSGEITAESPVSKCGLFECTLQPPWDRLNVGARTPVYIGGHPHNVPLPMALARQLDDAASMTTHGFTGLVQRIEINSIVNDDLLKVG
jgi:hypothetical protein